MCSHAHAHTHTYSQSQYPFKASSMQLSTAGQERISSTLWPSILKTVRKKSLRDQENMTMTWAPAVIPDTVCLQGSMSQEIHPMRAALAITRRETRGSRFLLDQGKTTVCWRDEVDKPVLLWQRLVVSYVLGGEWVWQS